MKGKIKIDIDTTKKAVIIGVTCDGISRTEMDTRDKCYLLSAITNAFGYEVADVLTFLAMWDDLKKASTHFDGSSESGKDAVEMISGLMKMLADAMSDDDDEEEEGEN